MQIMPSKLLAWWTRLLRESTNLSQEALAAGSGLTPRTIQRIESGDASSVTTRRALARGLGYDNHDVFDDPNAIHAIAAIRAEIDRIGKDALDAQFPDRVRLEATRVVSGEQLGRLAETCSANNFHYDENLGPASKAAAASIFDYLRDYADVDDCYSETAKLGVYQELDELLRELEKTGVAVHSALRTARMVGVSWPDKTPHPVSIAYLVIDKADKEICEIWAGKQFQFG